MNATDLEVFLTNEKRKKQGRERQFQSMESKSRTRRIASSFLLVRTHRCRTMNACINPSSLPTAPISGSKPLPILNGATTSSFQPLSFNAPNLKKLETIKPSLFTSSSRWGGQANGEGLREKEDKEDFFRRRAFLFLGETRERSSMMVDGVVEESEEEGVEMGVEGKLELIMEGGDAEVEGVG